MEEQMINAGRVGIALRPKTSMLCCSYSNKRLPRKNFLMVFTKNV